MSDLLILLPSFPTASHTHLILSLERSLITTTDLLTLSHLEIAKRASLPPLDVRRLSCSILDFLQHELANGQTLELPSTSSSRSTPLQRPGATLLQHPTPISTLSPALDRALGGGFYPGYVAEITGPSATGKTQFLLQLLLSAQLPNDGHSIHLSTEHPLLTSRILSLIRHHPMLHSTSMENIHTVHCSDLETQSHVLRNQLPLLLSRQPRVRLVVLDSVAANYRAEFSRGDRSGPASLAQRSASLERLGALLRALARQFAVAIVVANQVSDRFVSPNPHPASSPMMEVAAGDDMVMSLDHQQNWFTGWNAFEREQGTGAGWQEGLKTPALGHAWNLQIAARVALKRRVMADGEVRREAKVVFAPWAANSDENGGGVEFEIWKGGVRAVMDKQSEEEETVWDEKTIGT